MRTRSFRLVSCVLAVFAVLSAFGSAGCKQDKGPLLEELKGPVPEELPEQLVKEWRAADAAFGWMRPDPLSGAVHFLRLSDSKAEPGDIPAFQYDKSFQKGILSKLTPPSVRFGLDLSYAAGGDFALKELAGFTNLQALILWRTGVTDAGLKELAVFTNLQSLLLNGTSVTDAGMRELVVLRNLRLLNLGGLQVGDAGLKDIAAIKSLKSLSLVNTLVSDVGLKEVTKLPNLQYLFLTHSGITDAGLKELAGLQSLRYLDLHHTQFTDEGLDELKKALPNCSIVP